MTKFTELGSGMIGLNKSLVISKREDGRYSIAQQIEAVTDDQPVYIYLKNAITVDEAGLRTIAKIVQDVVDQLN